VSRYQDGVRRAKLLARRGNSQLNRNTLRIRYFKIRSSIILVGLLQALVKVIPPHGRLRLGMTNPPYILEHLEAMAEILNHPRVYKFLHVPVQSGSDQVLADMKREYSADEFRHVVRYLRER